ncbi:MAG: hypothetical protein NTY96_13065 [Bacteroidetes bacterium]|nr:hypothetical protein [Bacteroidota bacterium]
MIEKEIDISLCRQCELLRIHRSGLYYAPVPESEENLHLMRLIDEQYGKASSTNAFTSMSLMTGFSSTKDYKITSSFTIQSGRISPSIIKPPSVFIKRQPDKPLSYEQMNRY